MKASSEGAVRIVVGGMTAIIIDNLHRPLWRSISEQVFEGTGRRRGRKRREIVVEAPEELPSGRKRKAES